MPPTIQNQRQALISGLQGLQSRINKPIPVDQLGKNSGYNIPAPVNSTTNRDNLRTNLATQFPTQQEAQIDADRAAQTPMETPAQTERDSVFNRFKELVGYQKDRGDDTLAAQEDVELSSKREALNEINKQALRLDEAWRNEAEQIKTAQGGTVAGANQALRAAQDRYDRKRADLAIEKLAAQGDVNTALQIVEDTIKAKYEPIDNEIETLKTLYSLTANDMTESEKMQAQAAIQEKQDARDLAARKDMAEYEAKIKQSDPLYRAQLNNQLLDNEKLLGELNPTGDSGVSQDLEAYASQYADTGKLPSPSELKLSGLNVGQVTSYAKQMPKPNGAVVSTNTGTKSSKLSAAELDGIAALSEIVQVTLPNLKAKYGAISPGIAGRLGAVVYTSQDRQDYRTFRQEFLSKLLVARSGAAVTEEEYARYAKMLPSELGNWGIGGLSDKGGKKLASLETSMKNSLNNVLSSKQQSIYGYSKVKVGGQERTVGEILNIGGQQYRVLPDGTLTDII